MHRHLCGWLAIIGILLAVFTPPASWADEVRSSVVKIFSSKSPPNMFRPWKITTPAEVTGSGVVIEGGRILTNAHVVRYAQQVYVQPYESSDKLDATIEFLSPECDLATVTLDDPSEIAALKPIPFADTLPPLKAKINVLGYPTGGDTLSVTEGVVSRIEYAPYYYENAALRIQVDAAVNPGNSGGPGIIDDKIAGIVFSKFAEGENIGYLIPAEVVRHFLDDWLGDEKYDGFPKVRVQVSTLENPDMRAYLKVNKQTTGVALGRIDRPDLGDLLKPWDVILECEGIPVDNLGMVPIGEGIRVAMGYLISRKPAGSSIKLTILRDGKRIELDIPTVTESNSLIQPMKDERPTYFIYGGLVFSPVTTELVQSAGANFFALLGYRGYLLPQFIRKNREHPDDEIVVTCSPIIPHKLNKGYSITPLSVVTHVNDQPIRNLRHMIQLIKDNKEDFIIFTFEENYETKQVYSPKRISKYMPEILRNNNIPFACSEDLRDIWP